MEIEKRVIDVEEMEFRVDDSGADEQPYIEGLGVVYNREVEIFTGYFEKIRAGALSRSVNGKDEVKSYIDHSPARILATTRSKPALELTDTPEGLRFKAPIPPTSYGNDLIINVKRRNIRGASFSFSVEENGDILTRDEDGVYHREIIKAKLYEVGPVANPAYPQTSVKVSGREALLADAERRCGVQNISGIVISNLGTQGSVCATGGTVPTNTNILARTENTYTVLEPIILKTSNAESALPPIEQKDTSNLNTVVQILNVLERSC